MNQSYSTTKVGDINVENYRKAEIVKKLNIEFYGHGARSLGDICNATGIDITERKSHLLQPYG